MMGMTTIIAIYASMIMDGYWTWDNVPPVLLPQVEAVYNILVGEASATYGLENAE